jgi:octaprenyl-diphosphate synthase
LGVVAREEAQGPSPDAPSDPPKGLQPLLDLVAGDMREVNGIILDKAVSDVELIPELAHHLIDSGGKRLRPMLTLASARLCGYQGSGHIKLAAAVEFMHTATLLHDDVVDDSDFRRGKKSARLLWGNQASVLVGDFLLGQAFRMMVDVGSLSALGILSNAAAVIAEGEVMQLAAAKDTATSEQAYLAIITAKTAALFSAATEVGAAITNRPAAEQDALRGYGLDLGIAFQLVDDALDYAGESAKLGKATGDDFREGKITLPVILSVRAGSDEERAFWARTLGDGRIEEGDFEQAVAAMQRHGAIEATLDRARHYGARARGALSALPAGPGKRALAEVVDFCISRAN